MSSNYDTTLVRLFSIAQKLFEGRVIDKKELSEEFGVSPKTIQRDINIRLASLPIVYTRGSGWQLEQTYLTKDLSHTYSKLIKNQEFVEKIDYAILKAKQAIDQADAILITAGAGMGVDSGLPDFRGNEGFWRAYPPMKRLGLNFYDMANPQWFVNDPSMAWGFYGHRLNLYRNTIPHDGFTALKDIVSSKEDDYFIFVTNVDGQFQKAGFDSQKIMERHGSIHYNQCFNGCTNSIWNNEKDEFDVNINTFQINSQFPSCPYCNGIARPNILMFGDWGYIPERAYEQEKRMQAWIKSTITKNKKIAIIEIGAGKDIPTVRHMSESIQKQYNASLIRINPKDFDGSPETISIPLGAKESLEKIVQ